jgi:hypothetical protein
MPWTDRLLEQNWLSNIEGSISAQDRSNVLSGFIFPED